MSAEGLRVFLLDGAAERPVGGHPDVAAVFVQIVETVAGVVDHVLSHGRLGDFEGHGKEGIAAQTADRQVHVERTVDGVLEESFALGRDRLLKAAAGVGEGGKIRFFAARDGEIRARRFHDPAKFTDALEQSVAHVKVGDGVHEVVERKRAHEGPFAVARLEDAERIEFLQSDPHGEAIDAESVGELRVPTGQVPSRRSVRMRSQTWSAMESFRILRSSCMRQGKAWGKRPESGRGKKSGFPKV